MDSSTTYDWHKKSGLTLPYPGAAGPGQGRAPPGNGGTDLTYLCQLYAVELSISWFHTAAWAHQKTHTHTHTHALQLHHMQTAFNRWDILTSEILDRVQIKDKLVLYFPNSQFQLATQSLDILLMWMTFLAKYYITVLNTQKERYIRVS